MSAGKGRLITVDYKDRVVRAPRGTHLSCKGRQQEAALRMLMNNLDPEVTELPRDLVVYGAGKAARHWRPRAVGDVLPLDEVEEAVTRRVPERFRELNVAAYRLGLEMADGVEASDRHLERRRLQPSE